MDATKGMNVSVIRTDFLPFLACLWVSENSLVAAVSHVVSYAVEKFLIKFVQGHGCCPMLFGVDANSKIQFVNKLDASQKKEASGITAMKKFQSLDRQARTESNDTSLQTLHQNAITGLCLHTGTKSGATKFSTSGSDGLLVIWDFMVSVVYLGKLLFWY